MKKLALFLLIFPLYLSSAALDKTYKVVVIKSWKPYYYIDKKGNPQGYAVDLFERISKNTNIKYEYVIAKNWKEAFALLEQEKVHIIPNSGITAKRKEFLDFTSPTDIFQIGLYKRKDTANIRSLNDLYNKRVGVASKNVCESLITEDISKTKIVYPTFLETLDALRGKNVDAMCFPKPLMEHNLKELSLTDDIGSFGFALKTVSRALGVVKGEEYLLKLFDKELLKIKESGEYDKIYDKWFGVRSDIELSYEEFVIITAGVIIFSLLIIMYGYRKKWLLTKQVLEEEIEKSTKEISDQNTMILESQNLLRSVIDENPNPILVKDYEGRFILVNNAVAKLYDTSPEKMIGKSDCDFIDDKEMADSFFHNVKSIMDEGETRVVYENSMDVKTKEIRNYMSIKKPFTNIKGEKNILVIANDITALKKLEEQELNNQKILLTQAKVAAMGEMLGNIAHQWRQPLSIISTHVSSLGVRMDFDEDISKSILRGCVDDVLKHTNYLSKTIDDFMEFFKQNSDNVERFNIKDAVEKTRDLVKDSMEGNYVELIIETEDAFIVKNENQLIQALINICNNAKDAMVINKIPAKERYFFIRLEKTPSSVILTFKDSGGGIKKDILDKIFEPYFTTKHQSIGTGIGLYMTYQIITKHFNGKLSVENIDYNYNSKELKGARFTITIPCD